MSRPKPNYDAALQAAAHLLGDDDQPALRVLADRLRLNIANHAEYGWTQDVVAGRVDAILDLNRLLTTRGWPSFDRLVIDAERP